MLFNDQLPNRQRSRLLALKARHYDSIKLEAFQLRCTFEVSLAYVSQQVPEIVGHQLNLVGLSVRLTRTQILQHVSVDRKGSWSSIPFQLQFPPVGIFALGIERPPDMTVQRLHDADARHHRRTASRYQHQDRDRRLPFRQVGLLFRQGGDVVGSVAQCDELLAVGQRYWILELALPAGLARQWRSRSSPGYQGSCRVVMFVRRRRTR